MLGVMGVYTRADAQMQPLRLPDALPLSEGRPVKIILQIQSSWKCKTIDLCSKELPSALSHSPQFFIVAKKISSVCKFTQ